MNIHDAAHPVTEAKSHQQFSTELNQLLMKSAEQGVPLEILILELEIAKLFIFQRVNFQAQQMAQAQAQKNKPSIITPRK